MARYTALLLVLAVGFAQLGFVTSNNCTNTCNAQYADPSNGNLVTFCGTDGNSYTTRQAAINPISFVYNDCYSNCNIGVVYLGLCGCPNNCFNTSGNNNGQCQLKSGVPNCVCNSGWGGADCSQVNCPNTCSGHGTCNTRKGSDGGDYCTCNKGWTSWDCSVQIPSLLLTNPSASLPFGEYNGPAAGGAYYQSDSYGDAHPVFNTSVIATINVIISTSDLNALLLPSNRYSSNLADATMFFDNGVVSKKMDIEFRIKGLSSRHAVKKSWTVHFSDSWKGIEGFGLKAPNGAGAVNTEVFVEILRAMKAQTYRVSIAALYINNWYYGVELLCEKLDDNFVTSRWNVPDSNLYEVGQQVYLKYWGSTAAPYQNYIPPTFGINAITQDEGTGDWSDFVTLVTVLNATNQAAGFLPNYFDINGWLRALAANFAMDNYDSYYATGNNYLLINLNNSANSNPRWESVTYDLDAAMTDPTVGIAGYLGMTPDQLRAYLNAGITQFGSLSLTDLIWVPNPYNVITMPGRPLGDMIFSLPGTNATLTSLMNDVLSRVWLTHPGLFQARRAAYYNLTRHITALDQMYTMAVGSNLAAFDFAYSNTTVAWATERTEFLTPIFITNGNGVCHIDGTCTCNSGYSGPTCNIH